MAIQLSMHVVGMSVLELFEGAVALLNFLIEVEFSHGGHNNSFLYRRSAVTQRSFAS
jgi:hypothetical protein